MNIKANCLRVAACLVSAVSLPAQTTLTDFSSASGWGASTALVGTGGSYSISSGVVNYSVSGSSDTDFVLMRYTGAVGSYSSNWSVQVDVNYGNPGGIFTSSVEQFVNLGLMVGKAGVTPGVSGGAPTFHAFSAESNLYQLGNGSWMRDIRTAVFSPGNHLDSNRYTEISVSGATATAVQISYDAATHILTGGYDANGATGGYSFTSMTDLTADASSWSMTGTDTFSIYLLGASGYDSETGTGVGPEIGLGLATIDNLSGTGLTAIPEPSTYAACFGAAALGLAVWRRRKAAGQAASV